MKKMTRMVVAGLLLAGCMPAKPLLEGETGKMAVDKVYLCEVVNEYYRQYRAFDSADVTAGKFVLSLEHVTPGMYYLRMGERGGKLFLEPGVVRVKPQETEGEEIEWTVEGCPLDAFYRQYEKEKYVVTRQRLLDSLDQLFYAARKADDREEMKRIKEESLPYYNAATEKEEELTDRWIKTHKNDAFGIYLYYTQRFLRGSFPSLESIEKERRFISSFGSQAQQTKYIGLMQKRLDLYAGCAIGSTAPEITGLDTLDRPMKLSDFRGQYVIVDFWNSYCHWCREETPWLLEALEHFKGRNLCVLGISSDFFKKNWIDAIQEDKSYWNHLMLKKGDDVMDRYCIKGIPHTVLVDPEGKILAKDFRQKEIIPLLEKMMQ